MTIIITISIIMIKKCPDENMPGHRDSIIVMRTSAMMAMIVMMMLMMVMVMVMFMVVMVMALLLLITAPKN